MQLPRRGPGLPAAPGAPGSAGKGKAAQEAPGRAGRKAVRSRSSTQEGARPGAAGAVSVASQRLAEEGKVASTSERALEPLPALLRAGAAVPGPGHELGAGAGGP